MFLETVVSPKGYNKSREIASGIIIEAAPGYGPDGDQTRFLIHTGEGCECLALYMSIDELTKSVTGAMVDKICALEYPPPDEQE